MLGDRVRRGAELGEQAGGRRGLEQVAAAALEHARHEDARRVHVRHHVRRRAGPPVVVGGLRPSERAHTGVRAEEVDRPEASLGRVDERAHLRLLRHVARHREGFGLAGTDLTSNNAEAVFVAIGRRRSRTGRSAANRRASAASIHPRRPLSPLRTFRRASCDGGSFVVDVEHGAPDATSDGSDRFRVNRGRRAQQADGPDPDSHATKTHQRRASSSIAMCVSRARAGRRS